MVNKVNYEEAVEYILSVPKFTKKNEPANTVELMERLGRPERQMKVIHVAGTNGKGSVCAFLSSILAKAGKRTGLFTSPHLVKINERFQINNIPITDEDFLHAYVRVQRVIDEMQKDGFAHPTYFELLFASAMMAFQEAGVEYVVLETGLGGRLDATNIVEHPIAVVLTSISLDHTEILGDTLEQIAWEKAGIMKPGVPVVYDGQNETVEAVIQQREKELSAPLIPLKDSMYEILINTDKSIDFSLNTGYYENVRVTVPYLAAYQVINSTLALLTINEIDREQEISLEDRLLGIANASWQGRMETVMPGVILDGAHNAAGIREFVKTVQCVQDHRRIVVLFSAVAEKDFEKMIKEICEGTKLSAVVVTQIENDRAVPADTLSELFRSYTDADVIVKPVIEEAFEEALKERQDGLLFCVGSLYLVGQLKEILASRTEKA